MKEIIPKAVAFLRGSPTATDEEIYRSLVADGIERTTAARLVEFLPIVYSRLILRNSGVQFSKFFRRISPRGESHDQQLSAAPVWNAAVEFARAEIEQGVQGRDLLAVAARSAEFHAANQLLNKGSKLNGLKFDPPVLTWPEEGP